ncbi:MAG: hypothetical protein V7673_00005, partial [Paracoccus sp. (in: a-proteobacteria)]
MVRRAEGIRPRQDALQPMEALERQRGLRPDHGRPGRRECRAQDNHDRRDLPQGTPHGVEPRGEKGGRGRQIGR